MHVRVLRMPAAARGADHDCATQAKAHEAMETNSNTGKVRSPLLIRGHNYIGQQLHSYGKVRSPLLIRGHNYIGQ